MYKKIDLPDTVFLAICLHGAVSWCFQRHRQVATVLRLTNLIKESSRQHIKSKNNGVDVINRTLTFIVHLTVISIYYAKSAKKLCKISGVELSKCFKILPEYPSDFRAGTRVPVTRVWSSRIHDQLCQSVTFANSCCDWSGSQQPSPVGAAARRS
jgi:hypothetical protein